MTLCCFACLGWRAVKGAVQGRNTGTHCIGILNRKLYSKQIQPPINYYKILGISPKATQAEIKASFYKLSKLFHPDVSDQSEEASLKFRQITSAYEILGNLKLRKMYDRGLLPHHGNFHPEVEDLYKEPEVRSPLKKSRSQLATGRTTIYDFDEWSRLHYGFAMNSKAADKEKWQSQNTMKKEIGENSKSDNAIGFLLVGVTVLAALHMVGNSDHDIPNENKKP